VNNYTEWYNENAGRKYPLDETVTCIDDKSRELPSDILVDLGVMVASTVGSVYVSSLRITPQLVSIGLSTVGIPGILVGTFARSLIKPYTAYPLMPVVDNASGWVVFGEYTASTLEDYRFSTWEQSGIAAHAVRVINPPAVTRIIRANGDTEQYVMGDVTLKGVGGVVMTKLDDTTIHFGLASGVAQSIAGPCKNGASNKGCVLPPIRSINGVCADADGVITIRFE
jgi:hypothetical protein